jgi:hypothetical protein
VIDSKLSKFIPKYKKAYLENIVIPEYMEEIEQWKDIIEYELHYKISSLAM